MKLAAIRDALDRAGLAARTALSVEVGPPKPYEAILDTIEAGSRAEYRRSIGRPDDSDIEHNAALVDQPRALDSADEDRNARPPRPASHSRRSTTASPRSRIRWRCRPSATELGPDQIDALLRKWLAILPHPFSPADRAAGYRYDISILQAEFSLTQMLDKPVAGRVFFEQVIRDNLDIGRPDQVVLIFDRRLMRRGKRPTPGRFRTRVITEGVTPSLHVDYKHTRIKQYHKEGRALRTETTVNDTTDFGIGKRLTNLPALREIGTHANRRLLRVQSLGHDPITGADALDTITGALTTAHRHPRARTAAGPAAYPRPASGAADVSLPDQRVRQPRSARAHRPSCAD